MKKLIVLICIPLLFWQCESHSFTETYSFSDGWSKKEMLNFSIDLKEDKASHNLYFLVRNNNDYPYRNLILFTEIDGVKDTVEYQLADKQGNWLGEGISATKELKLEFKKNITLAKKDTHNIKIIHAMRKNPLYGIIDFSVIVD